MKPEPGQSRGKRSRSVALNDAGLAMLKAALEQAWKQLQPDSRLTRSLRAEILGLSAKTADRVLQRLPVDRASLVTAFACVGLEFNDAHVAPDSPDLKASPENRRRTDSFRFSLIVGAVILLIVGGIAITGASEKPLSAREARLEGLNQVLRDGIADYHAGRYEVARRKLEGALRESRELRDAGSLATIYLVLGELAVFDGDLDGAQALFRQSTALRESLGVSGDLARLYQLRGQVSMRQGKFAEAEEQLLTSIRIFGESKDEYAVAMVQCDLGDLALAQDDWKGAEAWQISAWTTLKRLDRRPELASLRSSIAKLAVARGDFARAETLLNESLAFWEEQGHARWRAKTHLELARVYRAKGDDSSASEQARLSSELYREAGDKVGLERAESLLDPTTQTRQDRGS